MVLEHLTLVILTFDPVTPNSIGFVCYRGWMCGPSLKNVGHSRVIDQKRKGYRQTDLHVQTDRPTDIYRQTYMYRQTDRHVQTDTCAKQYALSSSKGAKICIK